jgi:hypothetical protein
MPNIDYIYLNPEDFERAKLQYARYFTRHKRAKKVNGDFKAEILADEGRQHGNAKDFLKFKRDKLAKQGEK